MLGIEKEIADKYGLEVANMFPYKDTCMIVTPHGRKIVKKMYFSAERIKFIHGAKEHLANNGFSDIDRYICTLDGDPCFNYNDSYYTVVDFFDGRESSFDSDDDIKKASIALSELHRASCGYIAPEDSKVQDELGKLPMYFFKRLEDIRKLKKQAKKGKGKFDQLFIQYADYFIGAGEEAVEELKLSGYGRIVEKTRSEKLFCHRDYTHHNIILQGDKVVVTNFDHCCYELRVYDIANLIRRKMRKCGWDISKAELIIRTYDSAGKLDNEELAVMKIILQFPQKFWRIVNRYYNSRRSWTERSFVTKLEEVIAEIEPAKEFLKQYSRLYI